MRKNYYIGMILPSIITKNGTAKQSLELANALSKKGHKITFFTFAHLKGSSFKGFENYNIYTCEEVENSIIYKFIKNVSILEKMYLYYAMFSIYRFRDLLSNKKIDIINTHDWFGIWVIGGMNKGQVVIANINDVPERISNNILSQMKLLVDRMVIKKVDKVLVLDKKNKQKALRWLNVQNDKVVIVRSGIDSEKFYKFGNKINMQEFLGIEKGSFIFACANLLAKNRRYEDVIEAIYKIYKKDNIKFHLVILSKLDFDISYAENLKRLIFRRGIDSQIHFIDKYFTDEERMTYIKSCDALIFPNSPQTWGLTVLEAMALSVPVIVSNGSGVSEVLTDGMDSLVYEAGNIDRLKLKMLKLYHDKALFKRLKSNGQRYVLSKFTWERYAEEVEGIMESISRKIQKTQ